MSSAGSRPVRVHRIRGDDARIEDDAVAVEEPLEIRVARADREAEAPLSLSVTMRTPGSDLELAAGFLFTEGILRSRNDLRSIRYARDDAERPSDNVVDVLLEPDAPFETEKVQRHFYTTSSCGVCGKASLDAVRLSGIPTPPSGRPRVRSDLVPRLPERLREGQTLFARTGGLHAAGRFDADGQALSIREDVGRHNAVDKLIGERVLAGRVPLHDEVLVVSGRASFEILQKAAVAGFPFVVAVGAPSSLAIDLAREFGMTLVGFARGSAFNVYAGAERLARPIVARPEP